jgi:hypothetical protein
MCALYDNNKTPVWFEHPRFREKVDAVAIPMEGLEETAVLAADHPRHNLDKLALYPSLDVFVLGFPKGMSGRAATPIWKRGTIATEPYIDQDELPLFLIDTATREGMSGSPVYAQEVGAWLPDGAKDEGQRVLGKGRMFVGIYSGRINAEDEFKAQLGMVWKRQAIDEILEARQVGQDSFTFLQRK